MTTLRAAEENYQMNPDVHWFPNSALQSGHKADLVDRRNKMPHNFLNTEDGVDGGDCAEAQMSCELTS